VWLLLVRKIDRFWRIGVVLWSLYQDFEMAAAQARHTDNHEHPRIVCGPRPCHVKKIDGRMEFQTSWL